METFFVYGLVLLFFVLLGVFVMAVLLKHPYEEPSKARQAPSSSSEQALSLNAPSERGTLFRGLAVQAGGCFSRRCGPCPESSRMSIHAIAPLILSGQSRHSRYTPGWCTLGRRTAHVNRHILPCSCRAVGTCPNQRLKWICSGQLSHWLHWVSIAQLSHPA